MLQKLRVALDAMGGDDAPYVVIAGAEQHLRKHPNTEFHFFGDAKQIEELLRDRSDLAAVSQVHHTDEAISMAMKPSQAIRRLRKSSMKLALAAVSQGKCDYCVSAGNTGALMALAKISLRMIDGVIRPAICTQMPTQNGKSFTMLDLGANVDADFRHLVEFAIMGKLFSQIVYKQKAPRVALLNIGTEAVKGRSEVIAAAEVLNRLSSIVDFVGFKEASSMFLGEADVFVTDGYTGNTTLKAIEGMAKFMSALIRDNFSRNLQTRLGYLLVRNSFRKLRDTFDPRNYNGAVLLGLRGIAVKSHGSSDAYGYCNAIKVGAALYAGNFVSDLQNNMQPLLYELQRQRDSEVVSSNGNGSMFGK